MPTQRTRNAALLLLACGAAGTQAAPSLSSRMQGAFFGPLVGDALCLGSHYEYDAVKIKRSYGGRDIDRFLAPGDKMGGMTHGVGWGARNYHGGNGRGPAKRAGEQTDYGDYNILILEHLANTVSPARRLSVEELLPTWRARLETWRAWMCSQTKQTLQQVQAGTPTDQLGGQSNAMAIRHGAAYAYYDTEEDVAHAARASMFTHRETTALDGGEFIGRVAYRVMHQGLTPREAIEQVAASSSAFIQQKVRQAIDKAAEATDPSKPLSREEFADDKAITSMARLWDVGRSEPIKVGKASPTEGTLPGALYFILKYDDLRKALVANAMVGGDNASRSIAIGIVLGASQGVEGVPAEWKDTLVEWARCEGLLKTLPALRAQLARDEL